MKKSGFLYLVIVLSAITLIGFHPAPSGAADCTSTCRECHTVQNATLYHPATSGTPVMCIECHQQKYAACNDPATSEGVHPNTPVVNTVDIACRGCHGPVRCGGGQYTVAQLNEAALGIHGGAAGDCAVCHASPTHTTHTVTGNCTACHATPSVADHRAIPTGMSTCTTCHTSMAAHTTHTVTLPLKTGTTCATCHTGTPGTLTTPTMSACATCHTDQATSPINHRSVMGIPSDCAACHAVAGSGVKPTAAEACNSCHNPPVSGAPYISPADLEARAAGIHRATPDLVISYLSLSTTQTSPGSAISVTDSTKNRGGGTAGASTTAFYLSNNTTCGDGDTLLSLARSVPSLAGGATSTGTTSVTIPGGTAVGTYYICAHADNGLVVAEEVETNNTRVSVAISVVANNVDLVISSVSAPTSAKKGANITVSDATKNRLAGTADASTTRVYLSANTVLDEGDVSLGSRAVPSLAGGATSTGSIVVTIPAGTVAGSYYLIWKADDGPGAGAVAETDETNNTRSKAITIVN